MRVFSLVCLLLVGVVTCDEVKSYRGHHVLSAKASTEDQLTVLRNLEHNHDLVFLREPSLVLSTDMVVPPEQKDQVMDTLRDAGITVTVQSTDLQAEIDAEKRESYVNSRQSKTNCTDDISALCFGHDLYRTLPQVNQAMMNFAELYPDLVTMKKMAHKTHENRTVYYLQVGTPTDNNVKPVIFIEGLAHAREWVTTASLLYTVDEMLRQYRMGNYRMQKALQEFTWVIIPVVNPDGYEHTHNVNRLWRKNRRPITAKGCRGGIGVDLNRNYNMKWGEVGVSKDCRSDTYPGERAFSEAETANVRDLFIDFSSTIAAFLSVHAYSQLLLHPWGYATTNANDIPLNFEKLNATGTKMLNALELKHGMSYTFGTPYQTLGYAASGAAEDWALHVKPGIYSYCYELRPRSAWWGFELPANQIKPTGEELLESLLVLAVAISEERRGV